MNFRETSCFSTSEYVCRVQLVFLPEQNTFFLFCDPVLLFTILYPRILFVSEKIYFFEFV